MRGLILISTLIIINLYMSSGCGSSHPPPLKAADALATNRYPQLTWPEMVTFQSTFSALPNDFLALFLVLNERARDELHDRRLIFENRPKNDRDMDP